MSTPDDLELRCPNCDYDVRGLPDDRCPECGVGFDARELVAVARGGVQRGLPAGYDPLGLWCAVLIRPIQFARRFPARHDSAAAWIYSALCYVFAGLVFGTGAGVAAGVPASIICAILAGTATACLVCEILIAALLALCARSPSVRHPYHFWRGLTHYTSGFTLFTASWGVCACRWEPRSPFAGDGVDWLAWGPAVLIFAWWAAALISMVLARVGLRLGSLVGCVLIPVIGIGCIYLGIGISFCIGFALL